MTASNRQNDSIYEGIIHVFFWVLTLHFVFDIGGLLNAFAGIFIFKDSNLFDEAFLALPISVAFFYWNLSYLVPKFLQKGNWVLYCCSLLVSFIVVYLFAVWAYDLLAEQGGYVFMANAQDFSDHFVEINLLIAIASTAIGVAKIAFKNASLKKAAEQKQKEAELKYLTNQFNPHFLYNTLNGIYSKAIEEDAPQTTEAILRLSEIMRYPINQGLKQEVPLQEEVAFIEDFIALQKIRLGADYPIHFEQTGDNSNAKIVPLSLIVLVENAFKYGVSQKTKSPINFHLKSDATRIVFTAQNSIKADETEMSHKIGLHNLEARLQLKYKDKYSLQITEEDGEYSVVLSIAS